MLANKVFQTGGCPQVDKLEDVLVAHHVAGLKVAVDDAVVVQMRECPQYLGCDDTDRV